MIAGGVIVAAWASCPGCRSSRSWSSAACSSCSAARWSGMPRPRPRTPRPRSAAGRRRSQQPADAAVGALADRPARARRSASASCRWSTASRAARCSPASASCAARSPPSSACIAPVRIHDDVGARLARVRDQGARRRGRARAGSSPATGWRWIPATRRPASPGIPTTEPAFGLPAVWIDESPARRGRGARLHGRRRRVGDRHAPDRDDPPATSTSCSPARRRSKLLDALKEQNAAAVEDVVPDKLGVGEVQRVLQHLLREGVSIRDLGTILEAIGDRAALHARPGRAGRVRPPGARPGRSPLGYLDDDADAAGDLARPATSSRRSPSRSPRRPTASSWRWIPRARRRRRAAGRRGRAGHRPGPAPRAPLLGPHPPPPAAADRAGAAPASRRVLQRDPAGNPLPSPTGVVGG